MSIKKDHTKLVEIEKVFSVWVPQDKKNVVFLEQCDEWFSAVLTKREFAKLIESLSTIRDSMVDE